MPEQRKTPGLSSGEVQAACRALSSLHDAFQIEDDEDGKRTYLDAMWGIVDMMKIRLGVPNSVSSPRITEDDLPRPKITRTGHLELKQRDALELRAEKAEAVGKSGARSSANLHSHLEYLRTLTRDPYQNTVETRPWVEAFFCRVDAMLLSGGSVALSTEQPVPPSPIDSPISTTFRGIIDRTPTIADGSAEDTHVPSPDSTVEQPRSTMLSGLVVAEAESCSVDIESHIPQVVVEMYNYAKALTSDVIRGVITRGDRWIFLVLVMNPDRDEAEYWASSEFIILRSTFPNPAVIKPLMLDVITGILADWMRRGFEDIGSDDDWFESITWE